MLSRNLKQKEDSYEKGIEWSVGCPGLLSSLPTTMTASALPDNSGAESRNVAHTLYVSTAGKR